jgi:hypothetical protein
MVETDSGWLGGGRNRQSAGRWTQHHLIKDDAERFAYSAGRLPALRTSIDVGFSALRLSRWVAGLSPQSRSQI